MQISTKSCIHLYYFKINLAFLSLLRTFAAKYKYNDVRYQENKSRLSYLVEGGIW